WRSVTTLAVSRPPPEPTLSCGFFGTWPKFSTYAPQPGLLDVPGVGVWVRGSAVNRLSSASHPGRGRGAIPARESADHRRHATAVAVSAARSRSRALTPARAAGPNHVADEPAKV